MPESPEEISERNRRAVLVRWSATDAAQRSADARRSARKRWAKYPNPEAARAAAMAELRWRKAAKARKANP